MMLREVYEFMKKNVEGLENSFLMMTAAEIGVRESRMIVGEYVLTEKHWKWCLQYVESTLLLLKIQTKQTIYTLHTAKE